jgi:quinolinate synthase
MNRDKRERLSRLRRERNATILAHSYQAEAVQDLADFVGDSLDLCRRAAEVEADVIVFCGVRFMAETAAILNPGKLVLLPEPDALCPMAHMMGADELLALKAQHPNAVVVCYVNSTAHVKAISDICCTSANAVQVVRSIERHRPIIFVPDRNLGLYVTRETGRDLILTSGYCPTHVRILPEHIADLRQRFPEAEVMAHPECLPAVVEMADVVTSTSGMVRYARESNTQVLIVGTEIGLLHRLRRENTHKHFVPVTQAAVCPSMKRITTSSVLLALEDLQHQVKVSEDLAHAARDSLSRMLWISACAESTVPPTVREMRQAAWK